LQDLDKWREMPLTFPSGYIAAASAAVGDGCGPRLRRRSANESTNQIQRFRTWRRDPKAICLRRRQSITAAGTGSGLNDWKRTGCRGPCPPIGRHRYFHKLYASDTELKLKGTTKKAQVIMAMQGHVLAEAVLVGTCER
jgi:hypothetical protein